ncbi:MAG: c-type cytochrome [Rhodospirillaceae bacterium]|nr:c-type cytochrome [Rhodospirillaceae bacterium]
MSCSSCHSLKPREEGKGPSLAGVFGRRAGTDPAFAYSERLRDSKVIWIESTLDTYLDDPFNLGTQINMMIHGIRDDQVRADLIEFLKYSAR